MNEIVPEQEVKELQREQNDVVTSVESMEIADQEGMERATGLLSMIARAKKSVEERRKFFTKPLNDQVSKINALFKELASPLEEADKALRQKMLDYKREQDRLARAERERLRKLQEKEQKRLERQAAKKGAPAPPPPPPVPYATEQTPITTRSEAGTVTAKKTWDFEIVDESKLPRQWLIPNEKAIRAAVKAGVRDIPGVRVFQREDLSVRAK